MTAATPEAMTELDAQLVEQMRPPCEAHWYLDPRTRKRRMRIGVDGLQDGMTPCGDAAEYVMTVNLPCSHQGRGPLHFLLCRRHTIVPGGTVSCCECNAVGVVLTIEPV